MDAEALLKKHLPVVIILPEDTSRKRPGAITPGSTGRGDYHPCAAELFLSLVVWRVRPKPWLRIPQDLPLIKNVSKYKEEPIGLTELRRKAEEPGASPAEWELDVGPILSQNSRQAWQEYDKIRSRTDLQQYLGPVVYGRLKPVDGGGAMLQYWYLYVYNDAPNKHEGDWEMVCIELNATEEPVRAGYAGHAGGFKRDWAQVEKEGDDRPIVYVARGSHAAYFAYRKEGYRTNSLPVPKSLGPFLDLLITNVYDFLRRIWPFRDSTPGLPNNPAVDPRERGARLDITKVVVLPELEPGQAPPDPFWWMRLTGKWGSRHARGFGVIGPDPPWQHGKWHEPWAWLDSDVVRPDIPGTPPIPN